MGQPKPKEARRMMEKARDTLLQLVRVNPEQAGEAVSARTRHSVRKKGKGKKKRKEPGPAVPDVCAQIGIRANRSTPK